MSTSERLSEKICDINGYLDAPEDRVCEKTAEFFCQEIDELHKQLSALMQMLKDEAPLFLATAQEIQKQGREIVALRFLADRIDDNHREIDLRLDRLEDRIRALEPDL